MKILFRTLPFQLFLFGWLLSSGTGFAQGAQTQAQTNAVGTKINQVSNTLLMGGVGGVYFYAEPGELVIEVEKRDRNRRKVRTDLRALLTGPDRRVLQEVIIPDDGEEVGSGWGPVQRSRLVTRVESAGVYVLNVTVSNDRYGNEMAWGFRSNCKQYLIETARGHRDQAHEEPIVLVSPEREADICFLPRDDAFSVELSGLTKGSPRTTNV